MINSIRLDNVRFGTELRELQKDISVHPFTTIPEVVAVLEDLILATASQLSINEQLLDAIDRLECGEIE